MNLSQLADQVRETPLRDVLAHYGFDVTPEGTTFRASFDRVFSAFMLHHVRPDAKPVSLREAFRVLKPGGSLHLADFDEGERLSGGFHGFLVSIFHSRHGSSPHHSVLAFMQHAGFVDSKEIADQTVPLGRIVYYEGVRPPPFSTGSQSH